MATITTYGTGSEFVTSALMGLGATQQNPNGRFSLDGELVGVGLSKVIAEAVYIERIFRNGQSVNTKYVPNAEKNGAVRVPLESPLPFASRTTGFGGRQGTTDNSGIINKNPHMLAADDEFMVYLNQVNDQCIDFPELQKNYIPLDIMARKVAQYAKRVQMDRDASQMAEIIAYNVFRALNSGNNLVNEGTLSNDNAYADLLNDLNSKMDDGDPVQGAFTYASKGRCIIGRPSFINGVFSAKSGVILKGGDIAQEMLRAYDLDKNIGDKNFVGTGYRGHAMSFDFQVAPTEIWHLAEKYLGLAQGSLDDVHAIATYFDCNAAADGIDLGVKIVDAVDFRGSVAQPMNIWGHESFRKSYLVGNSSLTTTALSNLGFSASTRAYPIAPKALENADVDMVPIWGLDGTITGYKTIAKIPKPNAGNISSMVATPTEKSFTSNTIKLETTTVGAEIYYTLDGSVPTVATGTKYTDAGITISADKTCKAIAVLGEAVSDVFSKAYEYQA